MATYLKYDRYAPIESAFINSNTEWSNARLVHKFGRNAAITSIAPVCLGGVYQTPQVASATTLRVKAGNIADDEGQAGARTITLEGMDTHGGTGTAARARSPHPGPPHNGGLAPARTWNSSMSRRPS